MQPREVAKQFAIFGFERLARDGCLERYEKAKQAHLATARKLFPDASEQELTEWARSRALEEVYCG